MDSSSALSSLGSPSCILLTYISELQSLCFTFGNIPSRSSKTQDRWEWNIIFRPFQRRWSEAILRLMHHREEQWFNEQLWRISHYYSAEGKRRCSQTYSYTLETLKSAPSQDVSKTQEGGFCIIHEVKGKLQPSLNCKMYFFWQPKKHASSLLNSAQHHSGLRLHTCRHWKDGNPHIVAVYLKLVTVSRETYFCWTNEDRQKPPRGKMSIEKNQELHASSSIQLHLYGQTLLDFRLLGGICLALFSGLLLNDFLFPFSATIAVCMERKWCKPVIAGLKVK